MNLEEYERIFEEKNEYFLEEWKSFLRFKSISTDPAYDQDCVACAQWLVEKLVKMGFSAELIETSGKPLVFAERDGDHALPTLLYYGHYDVQPVDPVDLWDSDPFEPELRDGRLYARGALDNKGQTAYFLNGVETLLERGELPNRMKILIEGEEECGSKGLTMVLPEIKQKLSADVLFVCDLGMAPGAVPAVTLGLRGITGCTVTLGGLKMDLHSGANGGMVRNPATELARLVASLYDENGAVTVPGFYDNVELPDQTMKDFVAACNFNESDYVLDTGVLPRGGERGFSPLERQWFRPSLEVNGFHSGYGGPGSKTIIPSTAMAKITIRMVAGQDPQKILPSVQEFLTARAPEELTLEFSESFLGHGALLVSHDDSNVQRAKSVLDTLTDSPAVFVWEGASIPVIGDIVEYTGVVPILSGFGLESDSIHAPNESFALDRFRLGFLYACGVLREFASG